MIELFRLTLLAAVVAATTAPIQAQDDRPPEGAVVTGSPAPRAGEWTEKYVRHSDGVWIHYYELGSKGAPVVLLHGLSSTGFGSWISNGIAPALAATNRVYVLDMRYATRPAGSPPFPAPTGMNNSGNAGDVIFFMDKLGIDKAHIGGYSMGGGTMASLLQRAPERFITAHFGGSGPRETAEFIGLVPPDPRPPAAGRGGTPATGRAAAPAAGRGENEKARGQEVSRAADPPATTASAPPARGTPPAGTPAARGPASGLYAGGGPPTVFSGDLSKVKFPVISIIGEFDAPNYVTHRLYRELQYFSRVTVPGRTHMDALRDPIYRDALQRFVIANNPE